MFSTYRSSITEAIENIIVLSTEHAVHLIFSTLSGAIKNNTLSIYGLYSAINPTLPILEKVVVLYFLICLYAISTTFFFINNGTILKNALFPNFTFVAIVFKSSSSFNFYLNCFFNSSNMFSNVSSLQASTLISI